MWIDITWIIIVLIGIWRGWRQGLIISIFIALAWVLGIIGAMKLCTVIGIFLRNKFESHSPYIAVISFILIFIVIAIIVYGIGKLLERVIEIVGLGFINRALGVVLRVFLFTLLFSMFIWLINQAGLISPETKSQSAVFGFLLPAADYTITFLGNILPAVKNIFADIEHFFEDLASKAKSTV